MKLQLVETRHGNTVYEKFQVVLPREIVEEAGWHVADEIDFAIDRKGRVTMSAHQPSPKPMKITYDEARIALFHILHSEPRGVTWSEARAKAPALPIKPSPFWVARFVTDLGLERQIEKKSGRKIWRVPGELRS
jgi:bifunctional DNA-binding transcriptional regulator/antitoxin component of YhaV-PrlF toxin-antitoxin module